MNENNNQNNLGLFMSFDVFKCQFMNALASILKQCEYK